MNLLSTQLINKTKPAEKRITLRDGYGLFLRIHPTGTRSWVLRINVNGRNCDMTIGHWPEMSLRMARQLARNKRKEYDLVPPKGYTLKDAFSLWCSLKRGNIVSYKGEKGRIKKYIISKIGNRQIDEITAPMIIQLLKPLNNAGKRATLKRCLLRLREILDLAVCAGFIQHNPCPKLTLIFPSPVVTPMPSLPWQQLENILLEVFKTNNVKYENLFLLSLSLLLRPKEMVSLRWKWIKDRVLTIPAEHMKMRREHRIPLTDFSLNLLEKNQKRKQTQKKCLRLPGH